MAPVCNCHGGPNCCMYQAATPRDTRPSHTTLYAKVRGRCPMGCGETLFLGHAGYVTCSWFACPDPSAANDRLTELAS